MTCKGNANTYSFIYSNRSIKYVKIYDLQFTCSATQNYYIYLKTKTTTTTKNYRKKTETENEKLPARSNSPLKTDKPI